MATIDTITLRAAFTTQALATMGADPEWDRRLSDYLRAEALQHSDLEFGARWAAENELMLEGFRMDDRLGKTWRRDPQHEEARRALTGRADMLEAEWQQRYADPHDTAARELAMTPAPTLAAALFKQLMIFREDLGNDNRMTRDAMEIVAEDMARLASVTENA